MEKPFVYYLSLREVETIHRWRRTCRRENICVTCRFKNTCEDTFEDFQEIKEVRMKPMAQILKEVKKRKPDAFSIIGAVSGFGEKRIKEIAEGAEMSLTEKVILEGLSVA